MRALWVDAGNDPAWEKVERHDITTLFFALNDPRVTRQYLKDVRAEGYGVGVYVFHGWPGYDQTDPKRFAAQVNISLSTIDLGKPNAPKVQFDVEQHDPLFIQNLFVEWRRKRAYRDTSWTMEPMQGGWMSPNMVKAVKDMRVRVVPQLYGGQMEFFGEDRVKNDLIDRGFEPARVSIPFRDAALIKPVPEQGFYFTMGRLP